VLDNLGFEEGNVFCGRGLDFIERRDNCVWKEMNFILNTTRKDSELGFEVNIKPNN